MQPARVPSSLPKVGSLRLAVQKTIEPHDLAEPEGRNATQSCKVAIPPSFTAGCLKHSLPYLKCYSLETLQVCILDQQQIYFGISTVKKCHSNVHVAKSIYAAANQSDIQFGILLESKSRRTYQRMSSSNQYSPARFRSWRKVCRASASISVPHTNQGSAWLAEDAWR